MVRNSIRDYERQEFGQILAELEQEHEIERCSLNIRLGQVAQKLERMEREREKDGGAGGSGPELIRAEREGVDKLTGTTGSTVIR